MKPSWTDCDHDCFPSGLFETSVDSHVLKFPCGYTLRGVRAKNRACAGARYAPELDRRGDVLRALVGWGVKRKSTGKRRRAALVSHGRGWRLRIAQWKRWRLHAALVILPRQGQHCQLLL